MYNSNPIDILPINGGNAIAVNEYLRAMSNNNLDVYLLLLDQLRYHRNLFTIENDNTLKKGWLSIETALFWYGVCAIQVMADEIVVYGLSDVEVNNANEIISARGQIYINQFNRKSIITDVKLTKNNAIFIKRNLECWGYWIFNYYRYQKLALIQKYFFVNLQGSQKKVAFKIEGGATETLIKEISSIKNPDTWFLLLNDDTTGVGTAVTEKIQKLDVENDTEKIWKAFENYQNWLYYNEGRRYNVGEKDERNLVDEVQINTVNFDLIENDRLFWLKEAIDKYNLLYGKNAKVIKLFETLKVNNPNIEMEKESIESLKNEI